MRIGILETGRPPETLKDKHGSYPDMFVALLKAASPELSFQTFAALDGEVPDDPRACDGWLITGSRHGVYEKLPWMLKLEQLIRAAVNARVPVVGICFGHQIMAEALGGKVVKSDKGWGLGLHEYEVAKPEAWMDGAGERFTIPAVHQDQVVDKPPGAEVIASSRFCTYAALAYDDVGLSFQGHPEFSEAYQRDLMEVRFKGLAPDEVIAAATDSLVARTSDSAKAARWIGRFFLAHDPRRAAA
ncbi:MAG: gamma-glutamyl-gamma-aminobutyrate hydrolase family protein [Hyphomicrobiaceae bacterium]